MQYTIRQITDIVHGKGMLQAPDNRITRLLTDSRSLTFPEETLFFAIRTKHGDGHKYIGKFPIPLTVGSAPRKSVRVERSAKSPGSTAR